MWGEKAAQSKFDTCHTLNVKELNLIFQSGLANGAAEASVAKLVS